MRVCIIGCTGYLGSAIAKHLSNKKNQVIGVCRTLPKNKAFKKFFHKFIVGDIRNEKIHKKISESKSVAIIYTVSLNHIESEKNLKNSIETNLSPLMSLVNRINKEKYVKKFIYFSTMQVYGDYSKHNTVNEKIPRNNKNIYALTHSMCEDFLFMKRNSSNLQTLSLRLSNGYGYPVLSSCNCWWLVANDFCMSAIEKNYISLKSDGSPLRDFIHITDIALAVEKMLKKKSKIPAVFNLASGKTISMLEIAQMVRKINIDKGREIPIFIKDEKVTADYINKKIKRFKKKKNFKISTNKMIDLGIHSKIDINNGLKDTLNKLEEAVE